MTQAIQDVLAERQRQQTVEGWTTAHDDEHTPGDLALAAATYAICATAGALPAPTAPGSSRKDALLSSANFLWPWDSGYLKPKGQRQDLVRAAALLLAEIERLDRAEA